MEESKLDIMNAIKLNATGQTIQKFHVAQYDKRHIRKIRKRCVVPGCENMPHVKRKGLSFFVFPREFERRKEWLLSIGRTDLINTNYDDLVGEKICEQHFEKKYLNHIGNRINMDAIPTLNLQNSIVTIITLRNSLEASKTTSDIASDPVKEEVVTISDTDNKDDEPCYNLPFEFVPVKEQNEMETAADKENKANGEDVNKVRKASTPSNCSNRKVLFCLEDNSGLDTGIVIIPKHMDMEGTCRTCLATKHLESLFSVAIGGDDTASTYADMLQSCINMPVSLTDDLPKKICANCAQELSRLYHFISICRQSQGTVACYNKYKESRRRQQDEKRKPPDIDQLMASWSQEKTSLPHLIQAEHNYGQAGVDKQSAEATIAEDVMEATPGAEDAPRTPVKVGRVRDRTKHSSVEIKMYPCETCSKKFYTKTGRARHLRVEHADLVVTTAATASDIGGICELCGKQFPTRAGLTTHRRTHGTRQWLCSTCGKLFLCAQSLERHVRTHTRDLRHACTLCDRRCMTRSLLVVHMRTHSGERPFLCTRCGRGFAQRSALHTHELRHAGIKPYACPACHRRFVTSSNRAQHQHYCRGRVDAEERVRVTRVPSAIEFPPVVESHRCPFERCRTARGASFPREDLLDVHILEAHARNDDDETLTEPHLAPWRCPVCRREFDELSECSAHERIEHEATRDYRCCEEGCEHVARSLYTWRLHATGAHVPRPYACPQCDKRFTKACGLYTHRRLHRGGEERLRYRCERCNRRFAQPQQLRYHERTHTGERPYACQLCGKRFALNGNLTVHMRRHRGERPYLCTYCDHVGFYDSSHLRKHVRKAHPDKPLHSIASAVATILS